MGLEILSNAINNIEEKIGINLNEKVKNKILEDYKTHIEKLDEVLNTYETNAYRER